MPEESTPAPAPAQKGDNNLIAAISYLGILSIIVLLMKKDDEYVTFHARQGVVIFVAAIALWFVGILLGPLSLILNLLILVVVIIGFVQALSGKKYKMPVVGDLAEKINL